MGSWGFSDCSGKDSDHDGDWSGGCWGFWGGFMALMIFSNRFHILKLLNKSAFFVGSFLKVKFLQRVLKSAVC